LPASIIATAWYIATALRVSIKPWDARSKSWIRAKKIALMKAKNPRSEDLAEKWGAQMAFAGEAIKGR
jgi:predicted GIY-YIG superfamily endonuclease